MKFGFKLTQRILVLVLLPLIFQLLFVATLLYIVKQADIQTDSDLHAKAVIYEADSLTSLFSDAGFALGGYSVVKNKHFLEAYNTILERVAKKLADLHKLVDSDSDQKAILDHIDAQWQIMLTVLNSAKDAIEDVAGSDTYTDQKKIYANLSKVRSLLSADIQKLIDLNRSIESTLPVAKKRTRASLISFLFVGVGLSTLLTIWLAFFFGSSMKLKLKNLSNNVMLFASGKELPAPMSGTDEIASLDRTFHTMAMELDEFMKREKDLVDNASDVICSINQKGKITKINQACQTVWGFSAEDLLGTQYTSVIAAEDLSSVKNALNIARSSLESISFECKISCADGSVRQALWSVRLAPTEDLVHCIVHDITERKEVERLKQEFVSLIGHDLRSPLTSIKTTLNLLTKGHFGVLTEIAEDRVRKAERSLERLIGMINQLLDMERLESGMTAVERSDVVADAVVEKAIDSVKALAEEKNIIIAAQPSNLRVFANEERVIQVLVNLLSNAIKFSSAGSSIEIVVAQFEGKTRFEVKDYGRGIPPEKQGTIFQRFKQVTSEDGKSGGGFGLGLPICKLIVEQQGGTVGFKSEVKAGSTFWFSLPKDEDGTVKNGQDISSRG